MPENQTNINFSGCSSVLITGGSGLVGRYLTSALLDKGCKVSHLSRKVNQFGKVRVFRWDPEKKILDPAVFEGIDCVIHLAGANIGEKRWTEPRKKEIVRSRVDSAKLIHDVVTSNNIHIKAFISASAVGYYGSVTSDNIFTEEDPPAADFLGNTCRLWEEGADLFKNSGIRTVKIRTAVVLEKSDSALSKLMMPAKFGFLVKTGNGKQYMPWIHIADLCGIYLKAVNDKELEGPYNAVSPLHVTHNEFMKVLSTILKKPLISVGVPSFLLRAAMGKMSDVVLKGSRVSSAKIEKAGYCFQFSNPPDALKNAIYS
jgi:uncharacterized protein (TIGR01777 family)